MNDNMNLDNEAERDLINLIRGKDAQNFTLMVTCRAGGRWRVQVADHEAPPTRPLSDMTIGEGDTFAEAWAAQTPTWAKEES